MRGYGVRVQIEGTKDLHRTSATPRGTAMSTKLVGTADGAFHARPGCRSAKESQGKHAVQVGTCQSSLPLVSLSVFLLANSQPSRRRHCVESPRQHTSFDSPLFQLIDLPIRPRDDSAHLTAMRRASLDPVQAHHWRVCSRRRAASQAR